jgi:outer membrane protein assembly factor BamB
VIIGDIDVFGLDSQTGAIKWRFAPRERYPSEREFLRLSTDGANVYVGGVWGNVYAVDAATGVQKWIAHVTALPDSFVRVFNPIVDRGIVLVSFADDTRGGSDGGVAAFDAATGSRLWSTVLARHRPGLPVNEVVSVAATQTRVVAGATDAFVYGLDRATGAILDTIPPSVVGYTPADSALGTWFLVASSDKVVTVGVVSKPFLLALDAHDLHHVLWRIQLPEGSPIDVAMDSTRIYTAYWGGQLTATDVASGSMIWSIERDELRPFVEEILAAPAIDRDWIYVGADHDTYAFKRR